MTIVKVVLHNKRCQNGEEDAAGTSEGDKEGQVGETEGHGGHLQQNVHNCDPRVGLSGHWHRGSHLVQDQSPFLSRATIRLTLTTK